MDNSTHTSLIAALKMFFGFREGQNLTGFMEEFKKLSYKDKLYYSNLLQPNVPHDPPVAPAVLT